MTKKVYIAADHGGVELKSRLVAALEDWGYDVGNLGTDSNQSVDYPDYAHTLATALEKEAEGGNTSAKGVLVCGSGIGISISANRHPHVRCALAHGETEARLSRQHNNANVIAFGERIIGSTAAIEALRVFLATDFEGGRHEKRVEKINKCCR